jgi:hypothetical protein
MRDIVVIELQAPADSRQRLPHHHCFFVVRPFPSKRRVKFVGFAASVSLRLCEGFTEIDRSAWSLAHQPKSDLGSLSDSDSDVVPAGHLRPASFGIDRRRSIDDVVVDAILRIGG